MYERSSNELLPGVKPFVALKSPILRGSLRRCSSRRASDSASVGQRKG